MEERAARRAPGRSSPAPGAVEHAAPRGASAARPGVPAPRGVLAAPLPMLLAGAGNRAVSGLVSGRPVQRQPAPVSAPPAAPVSSEEPAASATAASGPAASGVDPLTQSITAEHARAFTDAEIARFVPALEAASRVPASGLSADGAAHNLRVVWGERNRRRPDAGTLPAGGEAMTATGLVARHGDPELRLRTHPDTEDPSNVIRTLPMNTRLQVLKRFPGDWYFVSTSTGETGFCGSQYVRTDAPEPLAQLHVVEPGAPGTAIGIAERYYGGQADNWGQDLRFYVNVLAWANHVTVPDTTDGWRQVHFQAGQTIWVPSQPFARTLRGVVNSGSLSFNVADALGVAELIERIGELWEDFGRAISRSGEFMAESVERHVEQMLWDALKGLAVMLAAAAGLLAVTTAVGAAIGALGGGVGAAPGAAVGFEVGLALLEWLGLGMLVLWVGQSVVQVGSAFASFFARVWEARGDAAKIDLAGRQFAEAVGLLLAKLLEALIMYVTAQGLPVVLRSVRGTRFGTALGETTTARWVQARAANVAAGTSPVMGPAALVRNLRGTSVPALPADVTVVGNAAPFHTLPPARLPANLPPGHFWSRSATNEWVIFREPGAAPAPLEIAVYSDGVNVNYVIRTQGRMIASDALGHASPTYSGPRLPDEISGTGAANPYRDPVTGQVYDKSHGVDYADTLEGPGVRNSSTDPMNFTPGATWWNRGPRNALVQRIRAAGGGYRELAVYDATPRTTANGTLVPREYVFVETNRAGVPQRAWRIPNDPAITDRSLGALTGRDIPLTQVPAAALRPGASLTPDPGAGATFLPGVVIGVRGDDER